MSRDVARLRVALATLAIILSSCSGMRSARQFRVLPDTPNYVLQSPDARKTPFPEVLRAYNGFEPARSWMDLRPLMELRIENAYYQKGSSRRGLAGYLGTEVAHFEVLPDGLKLVSVEPMKDRPTDDLPVQDLVTIRQRNFRCYRLYFEILFNRKNNSHGSVVLAANSPEELDSLSAQLAHPEEVCNSTSLHCAVFPEACSVSVEMKIFVNGKSQTVLWNSVLASVAEHPQHLKVARLYAGKLTTIKIDARDPNALRLPLLPGDHVEWR